MRAIPVLVALLLVFPSAAGADIIDKVGTSGSLFLKIAGSTRCAAMGGANSAIVDDVTSMFTNPAGLAQVMGREVVVADVEWIADVRLASGAFAWYQENIGTFGVSGIFLTTDDMDVTTTDEIDGTGETFKFQNFAVGLSYARGLTDKFSVGGTVRYIQEDVFENSAQGVSFDFGTQYFTGFRTLRLAMSTNNFGPDMQYDGQYTDSFVISSTQVTDGKDYGEYHMPLNFTIGVAYDIAELGEPHMITLAVDATHPNDYTERVHVGAEYIYDDLVFVRGGYVTNMDEQDFSAGAGVKVPVQDYFARVNYAFTNFGDFDPVHRAEISFLF